MMEYPPIDLAYLRAIPDCTGIIQHGTHSVPNRRLGYTTDDNARALIVATQHYERTGERADLDLATTYLSYLHHAQSPNGRFLNIMTFQRVFLDDDITDDCYGRTMWACGYTASSGLPENIRIVARRLFEESICLAESIGSPRAQAYTILGICSYLRENPGVDSLKRTLSVLADSLTANVRQFGDEDWVWYESYLTYGNAVLPLAMLVAGEATGNKDYTDTGIRTLKFLTDVTVKDDILNVIGNDGWYMRGSTPAVYDQQSIEAGYSVYLYVKAYEILGDEEYARLAHIAHSWFFGKNPDALWVYNPETKGCYDGITPDGVNLNQGAESTICFLLAQLAMIRLQELQSERS